MSASVLQVDARELDRVARALVGTSLKIKGDVLEAAGDLVADQVRARIESGDREAPDGSDWPDWSEAYEKTRGSQQEMLLNQGDLLNSIQHAISGASVDVGSNLVYAATHQFGDPGRNIPARAYLGLSADNESDLMDLVEDIVAGSLEP